MKNLIIVKCNEESCDQPSTHRINWPGRLPLNMCQHHAQGAQKVGDAIGCHIHIEERKP